MAKPGEAGRQVDCVTGRTVRWTWTEGPTAGVTHEHVFQENGTVVWRVLDGPQKGHAGEEKQYALFQVSPNTCAVSYLAASGHTLTVVLNLETREMFGIASGNGLWLPGRGVFEISP